VPFPSDCPLIPNSDFVEDRTHDGRKYRMLNVLDEFSGVASRAVLAELRPDGFDVQMHTCCPDMRPVIREKSQFCAQDDSLSLSLRS